MAAKAAVSLGTSRENIHTLGVEFTESKNYSGLTLT